MLLAVSSLEIRDEFMRRIRARFEVTGGEEEATEFCGLEITRDWDAHTVPLKQTAFARQMMDKYDVWDCNPEETPFKVGALPLDPHHGDASDVETFDYMVLLGDLAWYSRTNPGLSYAVHQLAQFMQNPGNAHVKAARRVLRYIRGSPDAGLTYHGSARRVGAVIRPPKQAHRHFRRYVPARRAPVNDRGCSHAQRGGSGVEDAQTDHRKPHVDGV